MVPQVKDYGWGIQQGNSNSGNKILEEDSFTNQVNKKQAHVFTGELREPGIGTGQDSCSRKTWENHQLSPLANLKIQSKQKVKAKAEL